MILGSVPISTSGSPPLLDVLGQLFDAAFRLPTAVFTWMMIPVALYWIVSFAGFGSFDLDHLDALDGAVDGALDGAGEGLVEGAGEGLAEGAGEGAGEMLAPQVDAKPTFLETWGFGDVPRSFSWSLVLGFTWLFSLLGSLYVPGFDALATDGLAAGGLLALGLGGASLGLGIVATSIALRPVKHAMHAGVGTLRRELVGRTCTIRTSRVDAAFGQAEVDDGSMIIDVRSREPAVEMPYGTRALIYDYDGDRGVFLVSPLDRELAP